MRHLLLLAVVAVIANAWTGERDARLEPTSFEQLPQTMNVNEDFFDGNQFNGNIDEVMSNPQFEFDENEQIPIMNENNFATNEEVARTHPHSNVDDMLEHFPIDQQSQNIADTSTSLKTKRCYHHELVGGVRRAHTTIQENLKKMKCITCKESIKCRVTGDCSDCEEVCAGGDFETPSDIHSRSNFAEDEISDAVLSSTRKFTVTNGSFNGSNRFYTLAEIDDGPTKKLISTLLNVSNSDAINSFIILAKSQANVSLPDPVIIDTAHVFTNSSGTPKKVDINVYKILNSDSNRDLIGILNEKLDDVLKNKQTSTKDGILNNEEIDEIIKHVLSSYNKQEVQEVQSRMSEDSGLNGNKELAIEENPNGNPNDPIVGCKKKESKESESESESEEDDFFYRKADAQESVAKANSNPVQIDQELKEDNKQVNSENTQKHVPSFRISDVEMALIDEVFNNGKTHEDIQQKEKFLKDMGVNEVVASPQHVTQEEMELINSVLNGTSPEETEQRKQFIEKIKQMKKEQNKSDDDQKVFREKVLDLVFPNTNPDNDKIKQNILNRLYKNDSDPIVSSSQNQQQFSSLSKLNQYIVNEIFNDSQSRKEFIDKYEENLQKSYEKLELFDKMIIDHVFKNETDKSIEEKTIWMEDLKDQIRDKYNLKSEDEHVPLEELMIKLGNFFPEVLKQHASDVATFNDTYDTMRKVWKDSWSRLDVKQKEYITHYDDNNNQNEYQMLAEELPADQADSETKTNKNVLSFYDMLHFVKGLDTYDRVRMQNILSQPYNEFADTFVGTPLKNNVETDEEVFNNEKTHKDIHQKEKFSKDEDAPLDVISEKDSVATVEELLLKLGSFFPEVLKQHASAVATFNETYDAMRKVWKDSWSLLDVKQKEYITHYDPNKNDEILDEELQADQTDSETKTNKNVLSFYDMLHFVKGLDTYDRVRMQNLLSQPYNEFADTFVGIPFKDNFETDDFVHLLDDTFGNKVFTNSNSIVYNFDEPEQKSKFLIKEWNKVWTNLKDDQKNEIITFKPEEIVGSIFPEGFFFSIDEVVDFLQYLDKRDRPLRRKVQELMKYNPNLKTKDELRAKMGKSEGEDVFLVPEIKNTRVTQEEFNHILTELINSENSFKLRLPFLTIDSSNDSHIINLWENSWNSYNESMKNYFMNWNSASPTVYNSPYNIPKSGSLKYLLAPHDVILILKDLKYQDREDFQTYLRIIEGKVRMTTCESNNIQEKLNEYKDVWKPNLNSILSNDDFLIVLQDKFGFLYRNSSGWWFPNSTMKAPYDPNHERAERAWLAEMWKMTWCSFSRQEKEELINWKSKAELKQEDKGSAPPIEAYFNVDDEKMFKQLTELGVPKKIFENLVKYESIMDMMKKLDARKRKQVQAYLRRNIKGVNLTPQSNEFSNPVTPINNLDKTTVSEITNDNMRANEENSDIGEFDMSGLDHDYETPPVLVNDPDMINHETDPIVSQRFNINTNKENLSNSVANDDIVSQVLPEQEQVSSTHHGSENNSEIVGSKKKDKDKDKDKKKHRPYHHLYFTPIDSYGYGYKSAESKESSEEDSSSDFKMFKTAFKKLDDRQKELVKKWDFGKGPEVNNSIAENIPPHNIINYLKKATPKQQIRIRNYLFNGDETSKEATTEFPDEMVGSKKDKKHKHHKLPIYYLDYVEPYPAKPAANYKPANSYPSYSDNYKPVKPYSEPSYPAYRAPNGDISKAMDKAVESFIRIFKSLPEDQQKALSNWKVGQPLPIDKNSETMPVFNMLRMINQLSPDQRQKIHSIIMESPLAQNENINQFLSPLVSSRSNNQDEHNIDEMNWGGLSNEQEQLSNMRESAPNNEMKLMNNQHSTRGEEENNMKSTNIESPIMQEMMRESTPQKALSESEIQNFSIEDSEDLNNQPQNQMVGAHLNNMEQMLSNRMENKKEKDELKNDLKQDKMRSSGVSDDEMKSPMLSKLLNTNNDPMVQSPQPQNMKTSIPLRILPESKEVVDEKQIVGAKQENMKSTLLSKLMPKNHEDESAMVGAKPDWTPNEQALQSSVEKHSSDFGQLVPNKNINSQKEKHMYFKGNGIKLPLIMKPGPDGSFHITVDLDTLCNCKNNMCKNRLTRQAYETVLAVNEVLQKPETIQQLENMHVIPGHDVSDPRLAKRSTVKNNRILTDIGDIITEDEDESSTENNKPIEKDNDKIFIKNKGKNILEDILAGDDYIQQKMKLFKNMLSFWKDFSLETDANKKDE